MNIKKTFIRLTNYTCPHGQENQYLRFLPKGIEQDRHGNYFMKIGQDTKTIFACHLDTVSSKKLKVSHVFDGKFIKTDGKSILGADDKAGVTILLYLIHNKIPGLYYFFVGEEVGCIGSGKASKDIQFFSRYDRIISFDRRDTHSIITHQSSTRSCSDQFADELANRLNVYGMNMRKDDTGVYTDSAEFTSVIQECTNISVGYYSEHTSSERQDIEHLKKLCDACISISWEDLPTRRNKNIKEYKSYNYGHGGHNGYGGYVNHSDYGRRHDPYSTGSEYSMNEEFNEEEFWPQRNSKPRKKENSHKNIAYADWMENDDFVSSLTPNREFMDSGNGALDRLSDLKLSTPKSEWFLSIRDKYLDDRFSDSEIKYIKENLLDMTDVADIEFSKELDTLVQMKNYH